MVAVGPPSLVARLHLYIYLMQVFAADDEQPGAPRVQQVCPLERTPGQEHHLRGCAASRERVCPRRAQGVVEGAEKLLDVPQNFRSRSRRRLHGEDDTGVLTELTEAGEHRVAQLQAPSTAREVRLQHGQFRVSARDGGDGGGIAPLQTIVHRTIHHITY